MDAYPYLDALVGGWFHQDFDVDGRSLKEVIASYKTRTASDDRLGAKNDITRFLRNADDEHLEEEFAALFTPAFYPGRADLTVRDWLLKIYELLS